MKEIGKGLLTAARLGLIGYCSYKVIEAANERRKERKAEREELMLTGEIEPENNKNDIVKTVATGAVVTLSVVQYATVRKIQKDVETMKNIINDLQ